MGQTCSSPTRKNVLRGLNFGADSFLELAGVVPFVGNFFDLIRSLKEQWGVLSTRIEEAREVNDWATEELAFLSAFARQAGLRLGEDLTDDVTQRELQRAVNQLKRSIEALNEEARRITAMTGNLARQRVRAALNGEDFESAKQAVEDAKEMFNRALMVRVDRGVQRLEEELREWRKEQREMWIAQREFNRSISARCSQSQLLCALACGGLLVHSANIGVLDLSPGFTNRVYLWLRYSNASVAIFGPKRNAFVRALATVARVAPRWGVRILTAQQGSLTIVCSVNFGNCGIAAVKFADKMVCGQDAAKDLSLLGLGDCRVLVAFAERTTAPDGPESPDQLTEEHIAEFNALTAKLTRCGCCWTTARRSIGRQ